MIAPALGKYRIQHVEHRLHLLVRQRQPRTRPSTLPRTPLAKLLSAALFIKTITHEIRQALTLNDIPQ